MLVMTDTIGTMNADDNRDIDHDEHCFRYDVISYPNLTLLYVEKGPLVEGVLGTRLDMMMKMMMIIITMMKTTMIMVMVMMTTIMLKRKKKELNKKIKNGFVVICKLTL